MVIEHPPRYWHGGAPGLRAGDLITPRPDGDHAHLVKGCRVCDARRAGRPTEDDDNDPGMVYVTTSKAYARLYAVGYPNGALYRVEPVGDLTDRMEGGHDAAPSWGCNAARILAVYDACVQMTKKEERQLRFALAQLRAQQAGRFVL